MNYLQMKKENWKKLSEDCKGEPVQYVLGEADFAGRTFHVEPGVLIPRPETAELCEWIEKDATENKGITEGEKEDNTTRILDICTGSGCIAITLGLDIGGSEVTGWDISEDALKIAQGNVALLDAGNVKIEYQDALKLAETSDAGRWNIIVSNPRISAKRRKRIWRRMCWNTNLESPSSCPMKSL